MKKALALDLDDLIFPFIDNLVEFANERLDRQLTRKDVTSMRFVNVWGGNDELAYDIVHGYFFDRGHLAEPLDGSVEAVDQLSRLFDLYIVTAREDSLEQLTLGWLTHHFPNVFKGVHLCNLYAASPIAKSRICDQVDAVALVDDSLHNVTDVAQTGRRGFLFGHFPWNKASELPPLVTRVDDWQDAVIQLKELA